MKFKLKDHDFLRHALFVALNTMLSGQITPENPKTRKRELVTLLLLSFGCLVTVNVLWLSLTVPWVGLQYVIVVVPDHTRLLLELFRTIKNSVM